MTQELSAPERLNKAKEILQHYYGKELQYLLPNDYKQIVEALLSNINLQTVRIDSNLLPLNLQGTAYYFSYSGVSPELYKLIEFITLHVYKLSFEWELRR